MINKVVTTYNGAQRTYNLTERTLVVGPTGSGKSSLLASLGLLFTGTADDAIGRPEVTLSADLALAMREDQESITVDATTDSGTRLSYTLARGKRPASSGIEQNDWRHPVRELRRILAQGGDAARRDLAPLILGNDPVEVARIVPVQVAEHLPAAQLRVDEIVTEIDRAAAKLQAAEKRRKELETTVLSIEQGLPPRPSPESIESARIRVETVQESARVAAEAQGRISALRDQLTRARNEVARLKARGESLAAEYSAAAAVAQAAQAAAAAQAPATPPAAPEPPKEVARPAGILDVARPAGILDDVQLGNLQAYTRLISLARAEDTCPLCTSRPVNLPAIRTTVQAHLDRHAAATTEYQRAISDYQAAANALRAKALPPIPQAPSLPRATRSVDDIRAEYSEVTALHAAATGQLANLTNEVAAVGSAPESTVTTAEAASELSALQSAEDGWLRAQNLRAELMQAASAAVLAKLIVDELKRLLDSVYRERTAAAEDGISRWLPKGHKLVLALMSPSGTRIFRLGLRTPDGALALNPSGGQRSALLLAMTVYLIERNRLPIPADGHFVVQLPEERGFSPGWLREVMTALATAPAQIILVSLHKPNGKAVKGWSMFDLVAEAEAATEPASTSTLETAAAPAAAVAAPISTLEVSPALGTELAQDPGWGASKALLSQVLTSSPGGAPVEPQGMLPGLPPLP